MAAASGPSPPAPAVRASVSPCAPRQRKAPCQMKATDVYIVDDDEAVRRSLSFLLKTAGIPSHTYASGSSFLAEEASLAVGCMITDLRMPGMDGLELINRLQEAGLRHAVIVISGHGDIAL